MKSKTTIATLAAVLALAGPAFSQISWGSTGAVTVALTLSWTDEALMLKDETGKVLTAANGGGPTFENTFMVETLAGPVDEKVPVKTVSTTEYGSKISVAKWGNVEILKQLVAEEILPQKGKAPFIAGWSLIEVSDMEGMPLSYIARHTDKTTVDVPFMLGGSGVIASAKSEKTVMTDFMPLTGEPPPSTFVHTLTETYKGPGTASVPFIGGSLEVNGLMTGSVKLAFKTEGTGIDKIVTEIKVPGAFKLDKIVGTTELEDVVEGSISVAAGTVVDLALFMPF